MTRSRTSASRSPPGAHVSVGRLPPGGQALAVRLGDLARERPSQSPWPISTNRSSGSAPRPVADVRTAAAIAAAVSAARASGEWTIARGGPRDRQRRRVVGAGEPRRDERRPGAGPWPRAACRAGPGSGAGRSAPTRRGGRGRASRRGRPGSRADAAAPPSPGRAAQRSRPSRIVHSSTPILVRIASATSGGTSSSRARIIRASARGASARRASR